MSNAIKIALGIFVLIVLASWGWFAARDADRMIVEVPPSPGQLSTGDPTSAKLGLTSTPEPSKPPRETVAAQFELDRSVSVLIIRASWGDDGTPAKGVNFRVIPLEHPNPEREVRREVSVDDGSARFERLDPGRVRIGCDRCDSVEFDLRAGKLNELVFVIPAGVNVEGRVVDANQHGLEGATIWLSSNVNPNAAEAVATSAADGTFGIRAIGAGRRIAARAAGFDPSTLHDLRGSPGETVQVTIVLHGGGGRLVGVVKDSLGRAVPDAEVVAGEEVRTVFDSEGIQRRSSPPQVARSAVDGRFAFESMPAGTVPVMARARECAPWTGSTQVETAATTELVIVLQPGAVIRGVVRALDKNKEWHRAAGIVIAAGSGTQFTNVSTTSGENGTFRLEGLAPGAIDAWAMGGELGEVNARFDIAAGGEVFWEPMLERKRFVAGRVLAEDDAPLSGWFVCSVERRSPEIHLDRSRTDAEGRFDIPSLSERVECLAVFDPRCSRQVPLALVCDFKLNDENLLIRIPNSARPDSYVVGTLLGPDARPTVEGIISVTPVGSKIGASFHPDRASGAFRIGPLPHARYRFTFSTPDSSRVEHERELSIGQVLDFGTITLDQPGFVRANFTKPDGSAVFASSANGYIDYQLVDSDGRSIGCQYKSPGDRSGPIAPGTYTFLMANSGWRVPPRKITVSPGQETRVDFTWEPATYRIVELRLPEGDVETQEAKMSVDGPDGRLDFERRITWFITAGTELETRSRPVATTIICGLVPGTYEVSVTTYGGLRGKATIDVTNLEAARTPIPIELR